MLKSIFKSVNFRIAYEFVAQLCKLRLYLKLLIFSGLRIRKVILIGFYADGCIKLLDKNGRIFSLRNMLNTLWIVHTGILPVKASP